MICYSKLRRDKTFLEFKVGGTQQLMGAISVKWCLTEANRYSILFWMFPATRNAHPHPGFFIFSEFGQSCSAVSPQLSTSYLLHSSNLWSNFSMQPQGCGQPLQYAKLGGFESSSKGSCRKRNRRTSLKTMHREIPSGHLLWQKKCRVEKFLNQ